MIMTRMIIFLLLSTISVQSQSVKIVNTGTLSSLRGLSVVTDKIIWASGTNGMTGRSLDGGRSWKWVTVKGFEKTDFRDIEAFSGSAAIIMGISAPAFILKTADGGDTWKVVYENKAGGMFLDAMDFSNEKNGIVIGDPVDGKMFIAKTVDEGNSWRPVPKDYRPDADSGEACFASSGTNIRMLNKNKYYFITGGLRSRLFSNTKQTNLPILQGKESTGANSIAKKNTKIFIVVGGDFNTPDSVTKVCFVTKDAGKTWVAPQVSPHGYRSCVEYLQQKKWITCGLNGVDYTTDDGNTWKQISNEGFNVCRKAKHGMSVFFAGGKGKIGKLVR
jgi:photosystem II stability/assembly factor-like uncharacterized protein